MAEVEDRMSAYAYSVLAVIGINVMLAVSLNMITGFCGQFSLGHAAFYGAGAYAAASFAASGSPVVPALLAGIAVAALLGAVVGFASLRLRHDFLAVTTIGVSFLFVGVVRKQAWLGAEMGISRIPPSGLGSEGNALLILACALATIGLSLYVNRSWMGFSFRAVGDDEDAARTVGISVTAYKLAAFTLGTAIAGLAGGLYAYFTQFIVPDSFGFLVSVMLMAMVVIGGTGSTLGVATAAVILTLLPELFRFMNDYRLLVFGALLVLVMRFAPGGLAGIGRAAVAKARRARQ
jgi:branched-chain amino acid transport system permease protein